jgi:FHA domain-containing protein
MPQVTLDLVSLDNKPLAGLSRRFEGSGGTIGRDEGNTLALPDAQRRVSRLHATISFPGGVPTITNSSAVLPIGVDGMQLDCGQAMPLEPGMSLNIGPYALMVRPAEVPDRTVPGFVGAPATSPMPWPSGEPIAQEAAPPAASRPAAYPQSPINPIGRINPAADPAAAARLPPSGESFADLLSGLGPAPSGSVVATPNAPSHVVDDPLAALLGSGGSSAFNPPGGSAAVARDPFAELGAGSGPGIDPGRQQPHQPQAAYARPAAAVIPEDFNPFELPSASARNTADPLSSMLGGAAAPAAHALTQGEESIDALFAPAGAPGGELLNGRMAGAGILGGASGEPSSLLAQPENSDPMALFGGSAPGPDSLMKPMRDDLAEIGGAYQPPRALDPVSAFAPPAQSSPPSAIAQSDPLQAPAMPSYPADALTRAFLTGANLPPGTLPDGLTPEIMAMVGSLLRSATAGAIDMLAIRANIKREVQASVTIISTEANNPLKFLPNADAVLQQLLGKRLPGFMRPDEAMRDAFDDLRAHELGVIAGTRAALDEVLTKFDPAILGERLIRGSLLERALPAMRKTRLWDLYLERYAQIRREVEDDFQSVFGKAFVAAYEAEIARMKSGNARES